MNKASCFILISGILACFGSTTSLLAQVELRPLSQNPSLLNTPNKPLPKGNQAPRCLPFGDDFSQANTPFPSAAFWTDQQAFVNRSLPLFPPSLGVATLDALDQNGKLYPHAGIYPFMADTLTSQAIRLDSIFEPEIRALSISDSIILSFFYQPGGGYGPNWLPMRRGFAPTENEELWLELFNPTTQNWTRVWSTKGQTFDAFCPQCVIDTFPGVKNYFKQILIPITDPSYLSKNFRFRFRNSAAIDPEWKSGGGQWHLDYVVVDYNRKQTDSCHKDLAFVEPLYSVLKRFQRLPARQFVPDDIKPDLKLRFRNLDQIAYVGQYHYTLYDSLDRVILVQPANGNANANIFPYATNGFNSDPDLSQQPMAFDFAGLPLQTHSRYRFEHVLTMGAQSDRFRTNDTLVYDQVFANEIAYDDGSPEAGIGINFANGYMAYRFPIRVRDTLTALRLLFNHTTADMTAAYFEICVWKSLADTLPEEEPFYRSARIRPNYNDPTHFQTFRLDSALILKPGNYFFGFRQINDLFLNIGFDQNTNSYGDLYFWDQRLREWTTVMYAGSMMLRPVFGFLPPETASKPIHKQFNASLFPNPAKDQIHIQSQQLFDHLKLYDLQGRCVHQAQQSRQKNGTLTLPQKLPTGPYFLQLWDGQHALGTLKFFIN